MHLFPDTNTTWAILASLLVALVGAVIAWWRRTKPARDRAREADDAILGVPAVLDRAGFEISAGRPGMTHRVSGLEVDVAHLGAVVAQMANQDARLTNLETDVAALKEARVERIVAQAESAHMWRAVADRDTIDEPEN